MENFTGISKNFYPEIDEDGIIRFSLHGDIPSNRRVELVVHDVATGTRRGNLIISGMTQGSGWWWVPPPGNHTESRRNLGDVILSVMVEESIEREFYLNRGGPGKKIEAQGIEIIYPKIDDNIYPTFWEIFIAGEYSNLGEIPENGVIVDIGSNYGLFSVYALDGYRPRRIVAVEPNPNCYSVSKLALKSFPQFEILNMAVTPKEGKYLLEMEDGISAVGKIIESKDGDIDGIDINSLIEKIGEDRIDLMKIDCEGGELEIFRTITEENMSRVDKFVIEYHSKEIYEFVSDVIIRSGFEIIDSLTSFPSDGIGILRAKRSIV